MFIRDGEATDQAAASNQIKGAPAKLVAKVDAPDAESAIARAIEGENVPPNERGRLLARRRD